MRSNSADILPPSTGCIHRVKNQLANYNMDKPLHYHHNALLVSSTQTPVRHLNIADHGLIENQKIV